MCPQVLLLEEKKTHTKRRMYANNGSCLDHMTFRKENSIKMTSKDTEKFIFVNES